MSKHRRELPKDVSVSAGEGKSFGVCLAELLGKSSAQSEKTEKTQKTQKEEKCAPASGNGKNCVNESKTKTAEKMPRWSCQRQTAGRGGKTVTLVVFPKDAKIDLEALAKQMRRALGCGSHVEENKIVLQGDISERANAWLEKSK